MSGSVVFYRFKAQKEASTVSFEGTGIPVWDLKREILTENKLGRGADFDFAIYNADTNEEYSDDKVIVPRNTSVIARRLPPSRPGRGNAQFYMASTSSAPTSRAVGPPGRNGANGVKAGHVSRRFDGREDSAPRLTPAPAAALSSVVPISADGGDEAAKIAAMLAKTNEQWKTAQETMSTATRVPFNHRPGAGGSKPVSTAPDRPVPGNYICHRCGQPGHWIQDCPNGDKPESENKPRIKRTTGIPRSLLQAVDAPTAEGEGLPGMMITAEGTFVVAKADDASWLKHRSVTANLSANDIQNSAPTDPDLTCSICNHLLRDPVKTPCCSKSFCEECIQNYLSENDFVCPECESKVKSLKMLVKDDDRKERAQKYLEDTLKASKEATLKLAADGDGDDGASANGDQAGLTGAKSPNPSAPGDSAAAEEGELGEAQAKLGPSGSAVLTPQQQQQQQMQQYQQQLQMLQNQIQSTGNILSSPSLPPQMRMQLAAQLQGLQYQYGQTMQMMQSGNSMGMPQPMIIMQQMQQMQAMQRMMMIQNGMQQQAQNLHNQQQQFNRQFNYSRPFVNGPHGGRNGAQYDENSSESPYMRVPINPKFRNGGGKRDRPQDFLEVDYPYKR